jgi:hypothetical protein
VQSIVELLYMYHFELNFDNFHNIMRCLDTLTEFVQGPCSLNQQAIIDSKFLEIANSLLNTNIEKKKQSSNSKSNMSNISEDEGKRSVTVLSMSKAKSNRSNPKKVVNPPQIHRWMLERIKYKVVIGRRG